MATWSPFCIEGFDKLGSLSDLAYRGHWTLIGTGLVYNATGGRNGLGYFSHTTTSSSTKRALRLTLQNRPDSVASGTLATKVGFAFRINFSSQPSTSQVFFLASYWDNTLTPVIHGYLRVNYVAGNWQIAYGTSTTNLLAYTIGPTLTSGRWYHIEHEISEFRSSNGSSPGIQSLSVDGTAPVNSTVLSSAISGTGQQCRCVDINGGSVSSTLASGESIDYDDLFVGGITSGTIPSPNTNMLGNCRVDCLRPDGDGYYNSQFTPSAGSRYQCLDETDAPNADTDYVSASTVNDRVSVTVEDLPHSPTIIHAIHANHVSRREGAGSRSSRLFMRVSGTDYESSTSWDLAHGTTYQGVWSQPYDTDNTVNPATGVAYTKTDLQSIEIGARITV